MIVSGLALPLSPGSRAARVDGGTGQVAIHWVDGGGGLSQGGSDGPGAKWTVDGQVLQEELLSADKIG